MCSTWVDLELERAANSGHPIRVEVPRDVAIAWGGSPAELLSQRCTEGWCTLYYRPEGLGDRVLRVQVDAPGRYDISVTQGPVKEGVLEHFSLVAGR